MSSAPINYESGSLGMGESPPPLGHSHRQLLRKVISIAKDTQEAVFSSPDWLTGHDPYNGPPSQDHSAVLRTPVLPPIRTKADTSNKRQYHIKVDARQVLMKPPDCLVWDQVVREHRLNNALLQKPPLLDLHEAQEQSQLS